MSTILLFLACLSCPAVPLSRVDPPCQSTSITSGLVRIRVSKSSETDPFVTRLPRRFSETQSRIGNIFKSNQGEELLIAIAHRPRKEIRRSFEETISRKLKSGSQRLAYGRFQGVLCIDVLKKSSLAVARRTYVSAILIHKQELLVVSYTSNGNIGQGVKTVRLALKNIRFGSTSTDHDEERQQTRD